MRWLALGFCIATVLGGIALTLVSALTGTQFWSPPRIVLYGFVPVLISAVAFALIWRGDAARKLFAACGLAVVTAAIAADVQLGSEIGARPAPAALTPLHSFAEFRRQGVRAFPHACGISFDLRTPALAVNGTPVQPVTGLAHNLLTPYEPDRQSWRFTDQHGFNNPPGQWDRSANVLVVGDSFAFGSQVPIGQGFVDRLRERIGPTVNLGCGGNGPLLELAALAEYGPLLRPPTVLWAYYEGNDLSGDLPSELQSAILPRYLTPGFSQGLADKAPQLDAAMLAFLLKAEAAARPGIAVAKAALLPAIDRNNLLLVNLRRAFGISHRYGARILDRLGAVLVRAKAIAAQWGGEVVFVYLPDEGRYAGALGEWDAEAYAAPVRDLVAQLGLRVIDVAPAFARQPQPRTLFQGHYTATGHRVVADTIAPALTRSR